MSNPTEVISIIGVQIPVEVFSILMILSGVLGYLIDQRLVGWIWPVRVISGLAIILGFGAVISVIIYWVQIQRYGLPPGWSGMGLAMVISEGTGRLSAGGFMTILVVRVLLPALSLLQRIWRGIAPYLRVSSSD